MFESLPKSGPPNSMTSGAFFSSACSVMNAFCIIEAQDRPKRCCLGFHPTFLKREDTVRCVHQNSIILCSFSTKGWGMGIEMYSSAPFSTQIQPSGIRLQCFPQAVRWVGGWAMGELLHQRELKSSEEGL